MSEENLHAKSKRWRHWSRVPPDPDHATIEVQSTDGENHNAYVMNESVEGMALLFSHAQLFRVGDTLEVSTSDGRRRAVITYIQQHGMFFRVGVAYRDRIDRPTSTAAK